MKFFRTPCILIWDLNGGHQSILTNLFVAVIRGKVLYLNLIAVRFQFSRDCSVFVF